jgi:hypothetical protein
VCPSWLSPGTDAQLLAVVHAGAVAATRAPDEGFFGAGGFFCGGGNGALGDAAEGEAPSVGFCPIPQFRAPNGPLRVLCLQRCNVTTALPEQMPVVLLTCAVWQNKQQSNEPLA